MESNLSLTDIIATIHDQITGLEGKLKSYVKPQSPQQTTPSLAVVGSEVRSTLAAVSARLQDLLYNLDI